MGVRTVNLNLQFGCQPTHKPANYHFCSEHFDEMQAKNQDNDSSGGPDPYWGRDLNSTGGLLDAIYFQLSLPPFKWPGLKALPTIAPSGDSVAFRTAVRSLIAVVDQDLAESMPAPPSSPKARHVTVPDELWDGLLSSSDEEDDEEYKSDVKLERKLEQQKQGCRDLQDAPLDSPQAQQAQQVLQELLHAASPRLQRSHSKGERSGDYAELVKQIESLTADDDDDCRGSLQLEHSISYGKESESMVESGNGSTTEGADVQETLQTGSTTSMTAKNKEEDGDHDDAIPPLLLPQQPLQQQQCKESDDSNQHQEEESMPSKSSPTPTTTTKTTTRTSMIDACSTQKQARKNSFNSPSRYKKQTRAEVSPIALAALWELLQCCIGASSAAGEAAKEFAAFEEENNAHHTHRQRQFSSSAYFKKDSTSLASPKMKQQARPPIVRFYDARARVALAMVSVWLQVPPRKVATLEVLLGSDKAPMTVRTRTDGSSVAADRYRYLKVGLAAVGGGALFAVTGGLAAPAIAAGVGSLLTGVVPGAAAVAGFMSTQVGVAAVTTGLATAGAAHTGQKMAYRTADVKDFGFIELKETMSPAALLSPEGKGKSLDRERDALDSDGTSSSVDPGHLTLSKENSGGGASMSRRPSRSSLQGISSGLPQGHSSGSMSQEGDGPRGVTVGVVTGDIDEGQGQQQKQRGHSQDKHTTRASVHHHPTSSTAPAANTTTAPSSWRDWFTGKKSSEEDLLLHVPCRTHHLAEGIKLSTVIAVSGWIASPDDFVVPWQCIRAPASDRFALQWCTSELMSLNSALGALLAKGAAGQAARLSLQHLLVGGAGLVSALGPTVILGAAAGLLIENAWTVAGDRADKAGKLLAHVITSGGSGGRPVTLIAHSMGSRLVFAALLELCRLGARGLVQDVVLLGAPVTPTMERWKLARRVVAGRFINGYSKRDWLLSVMYWQGVSKPAAGLAPVEVEGIENVSLGSLVGGHFEYVQRYGEIFDMLSVVG